jgi:5,10-methylenetetrahydromethanopterin reductase
MDVAVNFNGDLSFEKIREGSKIAEKLGYSNIWVGESVLFKHPFPVITYIAHETNKIRVGSGIISYFLNRDIHVKKAFETLVETYGERFAITLAPGDINALREMGLEPRKPLKRLEETITELGSSALLQKTPIYVGASGPKMIETGSRLGDGVLLNYAHPEYVKWAKDHVRGKTYLGVYAPAILTPDEKNEKSALLASAFVAAGTNPVFQKEFGLEEEVWDIRKILKKRRYSDLESKKKFLFERFLISGDTAAILDKIDEFKKMRIDQVILGSPFNYNLKSVETIGQTL